MSSGKDDVRASDDLNEESSLETINQAQRGKWARIQEIIWDGPRSEEEKKLVQRLDIFLM